MGNVVYSYTGNVGYSYTGPKAMTYLFENEYSIIVKKTKLTVHIVTMSFTITQIVERLLKSYFENKGFNAVSSFRATSKYNASMSPGLDMSGIGDRDRVLDRIYSDLKYKKECKILSYPDSPKLLTLSAVWGESCAIIQSEVISELLEISKKLRIFFNLKAFPFYIDYTDCNFKAEFDLNVTITLK